MKIINKKIVTKSNSLINANYELSTQEFRLIGKLIAEVNPKQDREFLIYTFTAKELADAIGCSKSSYYSELRKVTKKLMSRVIEFEEDNVIKQRHWVETADYKIKQGTVTLRLSEEIKQFLLHLKGHFTSYELQNILPLQSKYSCRFYELFKEALGKQHSKLFVTLEHVRKTFKLSNGYKDWTTFRRSILEVAIPEINEHTDITVTWKPRKLCRKVEGITFSLSAKESKKDEKSADVFSLLPEKTQKLKTLRVEIERYLKKKGEEYVVANIFYVNKRYKKLSGYRTYLVKALKNDYAQQEAETEKLKEEERKENVEKVKNEQKNMQEMEEKEQKIKKLKETISEEEIKKYIPLILETSEGLKVSYERISKRDKSKAFNFIKEQIILRYYISPAEL